MMGGIRARLARTSQKNPQMRIPLKGINWTANCLEICSEIMCDLIPLLDQMITLEGISSPFSFFSHFEIILSEVINPTTAEQGKVVLVWEHWGMF